MQRFRHSQGDLGYLRVVRMLRLLRLVRLGRSWQKTVHPSLASNSFGHSDLSCMFITYSGGYSRLLCLQEYLGVPVKASTILVPSVATLPRSRLAWKVMKMSRNLWLLVQGFIAPWTCKVQISLGPIGNTAHCTYTVLSFFFSFGSASWIEVHSPKLTLARSLSARCAGSRFSFSSWSMPFS